MFPHVAIRATTAAIAAALQPLKHKHPPRTEIGAPSRRLYHISDPMLQTPRLRLRRWESRDVTPFLNLCRDPRIMQFFGGIMAPITCFEEMERQEVCFDTHGYGIWAVELKVTGEFIGAIGIEPTMMVPKGMTARLTWKLKREHWGMNYAYEAACEVMDYAVSELEVKEFFAQVAPTNMRSFGLVGRLGFTKNENMLDSYFKSAA